jgi:hypothetical protein
MLTERLQLLDATFLRNGSPASIITPPDSSGAPKVLAIIGGLVLLLIVMGRCAPPTSAQDVVTIEGRGQLATDAFFPPAPQSAVAFTHNGQRNFIVRAYTDAPNPDLLVNKIGPYEGTRLLTSSGAVTLEIEADGTWTAILQPIPWSGETAFSGRGDAVSGQFDPPAPGAWSHSHDGQRNFIVRLHCAGARPQLVQNRIGASEGSQIITFGRSPCFWEVEADGAWSLAPR